MKRQAVSLIGMLGLLLMAGPAVAQTIYVSANIPFDFAVGNKTLPAGTYDVSTIDNRSDKMLLVQAQDGHSSIVMNRACFKNTSGA
jgi:hypothetical protein